MFATLPQLKCLPGRPKKRVLSVAEVAAIFELPEAIIRARCSFSFFPGAVRDEGTGEWEIPEAGLVAALRCSVEPHWSVRRWAGLLDLSYHALRRITAPVASLDAPLPVGKRLRALLVCVSDGAPVQRVPESEIRRFLGLNKGGKAA